MFVLTCYPGVDGLVGLLVVGGVVKGRKAVVGCILVRCRPF